MVYTRHADQSVRLCVGDTLASSSTVFQIVDYPNHAQAEAGSQFERLADDAFWDRLKTPVF